MQLWPESCCNPNAQLFSKTPFIAQNKSRVKGKSELGKQTVAFLVNNNMNWYWYLKERHGVAWLSWTK